MIFRDNKDRAMIRALLADFAAVEAACVPAPGARNEPAIAGYFARSNNFFAQSLPFAHRFAARLWGEPIADHVCKIYGGGSSLDTVKPDRVAECFAAFTRLGDPWLIEPRPAAKLKPFVAQSGLEARVAGLEFAALIAKRADKADQLRRKLWASVKPFESVSAYYDLEIWHVPPPMDGTLATGLIRMTVGTWKEPCPNGLKELESFLALPIGSKHLRKMAANMREWKAEAWDAFERYAKKRLEPLDGEEHDRLRAAFDTARKHGRNLYPNYEGAIHREVFADKRNAPEATLEEFAQMEKDFVALRSGWYAANRKADIVEKNSKLVAGLIDNGLTEFN